jgi:arylsulfatase A-like enzyme
MRSVAVFAAVFALAGLLLSSEAAPPNILLIYGDDVGYGDFGCYGGTGARTPNVDRLAKDGLRFTGGYCSSATCTPSRYSMLTGEYAFRREGTGVLPGDAALIIDPARVTLPAILRKAGYRTAVVGKWHLGLGDGGGPIDWNAEIAPGPREVGFDESFIMAATGDRVPCVYLENQRVVGLDPKDPIAVSYKEPFPGEPLGTENREALKQDWSHGHNMAVVNGIGRIGHMKGGQAARWKDEDMADTFTRKALDFMERSKDGPFFLYFATHDIHVPRVPHPRFVGKTTMGPRGDAIAQFDGCVGELLKKLDELKLADNTLVIVTSDNGPVLDDGYKDGAVEKLGDHRPAGPWRGGKYSIYEGGTRVPFVVRWPGRVKPGASDAIVSQVDFCATFAALSGRALGPGDAPDSMDVLAALLGDSPKGRDHVLEHAGKVAVRQGPWKLIPGEEGGSKANERGPKRLALYNLDQDPGESQNVADRHPDRVKAMGELLEKIRASGRSRS